MCRWCDYSGDSCEVREGGAGVRAGNFLLYVSAIQAEGKCSSASESIASLIIVIVCMFNFRISHAIMYPKYLISQVTVFVCLYGQNLITNYCV